MKIYSISFIFLLIIASSCKSSKRYTALDFAKPMSAKKVIKNHNLADNNKQTIDAKFKSRFNNGKMNQSFSVDLKIIKDEVIYLKGSKFITVFKAKITPDSVSYYSPYEKKYFIGNFTSLQKILGVAINFEQLQNLFLGQSVIDLTKQKSEVVVAKKKYVVAPKFQKELFDFFLHVNSENFKLNQQSLLQMKKNQRLDIVYNSYLFKEDEFFPENFYIEAKKENQSTKLSFVLKSVFFNKALSIPFSIPKNYKKLSF